MFSDVQHSKNGADLEDRGCTGHARHPTRHRGQNTCDDCRSASSARLLTRRTSLSAGKQDEQDEPLRAKRRCAVDENDCDLQVATSRSRDTSPFKRDLPFRVDRRSRTRGLFLSGLVASGVKPPEVLDTPWCVSLVAAQASGGFTDRTHSLRS